MPPTLHAAHYADHALQATVPVCLNQQVANSTYRLRFRSPEIAARIRPGQFLMLRIDGYDDPLIGRPLAMYDVVAESRGDALSAVDVVYAVGGKMTTRLAALLPGQNLVVWGPLGNGFQIPDGRHLIMVAGGIGQTPFLALGQQALGTKGFAGQPRRQTSPHVTLCYGARSASYLAGIDEFAAAGFDVRIATDDGSAGRHGLVTALLEEILNQPTAIEYHIACCGPEPMMEAVAQLASKYQVACDVSLETPMACGIGICFSCVAKVRDGDGQWDYQRTCVEGPVFSASAIEW